MPGYEFAGTRLKTGINFMEDVVNTPVTNPPEFLTVTTGGTVIHLSDGQQRRVHELSWREMISIFRHPYIIVEDEDEDADSLEIINTAHIVSVK